MEAGARLLRPHAINAAAGSNIAANACPDGCGRALDRDLSNNAERWQRMQAAYREVAAAFESAGLEYVVLKGFSHCPLFVADPRHRSQGDIDLLFPRRIKLRAGRELRWRLGL